MVTGKQLVKIGSKLVATRKGVLVSVECGLLKDIKGPLKIKGKFKIVKGPTPHVPIIRSILSTSEQTFAGETVPFKH